MAEKRVPPRPTYVVLRQVGDGRFELVGEVERRPGLTAKVGRRAAIVEAIGREPDPGEVYAAVARSEWRIGFDW
ncbi:hypothetical protein [Flindersiella endophytica]